MPKSLLKARPATINTFIAISIQALAKPTNMEGKEHYTKADIQVDSKMLSAIANHFHQ